MKHSLFRAAFIGGVRAITSGYIAGGAALGFIFLVFGVFEELSANSLVVALGITLAAIVIAPFALFGLWFLLLPAFSFAFACGLLFQHFKIKLRWLACALGAFTGATIAYLRDVIAGANFNWLGNAAYRDHWEFMFVLAVAGVAGGWFAYPAWFPSFSPEDEGEMQ